MPRDVFIVLDPIVSYGQWFIPCNWCLSSIDTENSVALAGSWALFALLILSTFWGCFSSFYIDGKCSGCISGIQNLLPHGESNPGQDPGQGQDPDPGPDQGTGPGPDQGLGAVAGIL